MSVNFNFLKADSEQLYRFAALGESYFRSDPNTTLVKIRQYAELLAQDVAARFGVLSSSEAQFTEVLRDLGRSGSVPRTTIDLFHILRKSGNDAVHNGLADYGVALTSLKVARELGLWFSRSFGSRPDLKVGPFIPPPAPVDPTDELRKELERLQSEAEKHRSKAEIEKSKADALALQNEAASERLQREIDERTLWQQLAEQADGEAAAMRYQLEELQSAALVSSAVEKAKLEQSASAAANLINLDEAETRALIDEQLRDAGWLADTPNLRYAKGARPSKGINQAIAEWPTASGPADYVLFAGLKLVGTVEAKRSNKNVMSVLTQAERYSRDIIPPAGSLCDGAPWAGFNAPFVFSTNGRPYLRQLEMASGIWRRDARRPTNPAAALTGWPTPAGLLESLQVDRDASEANLKAQSFEFGFPLRHYQRSAIERVEIALSQEKRRLLVAMATGTGKTKLAIAMLYRLIAAKRFRRVCFVVDRSSLGDQAEREFENTKIVSGKAFADIFGLKGLSDTVPDPETRVHICTIQGLVKRILFSDLNDSPPVDQYDLMIVDECHRGYLLDHEMSDDELAFRNEVDYISKYRRVLEHFDAVKVGLTATPALHTVEIFDEPIFTYSYREAVVDGYLVDHEPPIRITTALARTGIHFGANEDVEFVHAPTGSFQTFKLPDDMDFNVDGFNRSVVTEPFNRAVATELTNHIEPFGPEKTLVFASSDAHADIVVSALRDAFRLVYGEIEDALIQKITGKVDKVGQLILAYRNDSLPKIAVTVDLLTTGIDVPKITNLVFLRQVNSRILYEQMLGRATRLCPEIGKEVFRIFDAVDIYRRLQAVTEMQPVAVNPSISLAQLFRELVELQEPTHLATVRDQLIVKLSRRLKRLHNEARAKTELAAGESPEDLLARLRGLDPQEASDWVKARPGIGPALDWSSTSNSPALIPISQHEDSVLDVSHDYGEWTKPADYLDAFTEYIKSHINEIAALQIIVQRPRDLTRAQLRAIRLELDAKGFSDERVRRAWNDARNVDIAASIIGFIRQAALGDPLIPYVQRVKHAVAAILQKQEWTEVQKRWLRRIGEQLEKEIIVDRESLDREPFKGSGGFRIVDKVFNGKLELVLGDLREEIWRKAS